MKKNVMKIAVLLILAVLCVSVFATVVNATGDEYSFKNYTEQNVRRGAKDKSGVAKIAEQLVGSALTIVQVVGSGVAVIMLVVLAIKYISAAPSDKAEIKKHAVVYVVGAVVLFAATGIIGIVRYWSNVINSTVS